MNSFRVRIFLCCVPAIFANGCDSTDPCAGLCEPDEVCVNGDCVLVVECNSNDDCDAGEVCTGGNCVFGDGCDGDADCAAAQECSDGLCVPDCDDPNACNDNDPCTMDFCIDQFCTTSRFTCGSVANCPPGCNTTCASGSCSPD